MEDFADVIAEARQRVDTTSLEFRRKRLMTEIQLEAEFVGVRECEPEVSIRVVALANLLDRVERGIEMFDRMSNGEG